MVPKKMFIVGIGHIPVEDLKRLNRSDILVADAIFRVNAVRRKETENYNISVHPSRKYLSRVTGVCESWVSHCVVKLEKMGIIEVTRSKKVNGHWRLNWYRIGQRVIGLCNRIVKGLKIVRCNRVDNDNQVVKNKELLVNTEQKYRELVLKMKRYYGCAEKFVLK